MVFQAVRTRFPLRIAAGMTELGLLQEPQLIDILIFSVFSVVNFLTIPINLTGEYNMDGTVRAGIKPGIKVSVVLKKDQRTGVLTEGIVKEILTKSPTHPHGIKVRSESGEVGRVKHIQ